MKTLYSSTEEPDSTNPDLSEFFDSTTKKFKVMPEETVNSERKTPAGTIGLLAGAINYLASPLLFNVDRVGNSDEISSVLAIVAGVFIGSIKDIRQLCSDEPEKGLENNLNLAKAGAGGIFSGLTLAALTPQILLSFVDGGIVLATTLAATGFAAYYNYSKKKKYCPHCKHPGNCSQRVCRNCFRIFYPEDRAIDCSKSFFLDWYDIACFFDNQGLSYLDSMLLVRENIKEWEIYKEEDNIRIDCASFREWSQDNKDIINSYRNKGRRKLENRDMITYLEERAV